jgi:tripartite-type tricarboxylate transporter receptor subunit TctC
LEIVATGIGHVEVVPDDEIELARVGALELCDGARGERAATAESETPSAAPSTSASSPVTLTLVHPAGTKLNDALVKALDDEGTRKRLLDHGSVIPDQTGRTPDALRELVESEVQRWARVLKGTSN